MKPKILFSELPKTHWWGTGTPKYENNWAMKQGRIPDQKQVLIEHTSCLETLQEHTALEIKPFPSQLEIDQLHKHDAIFTRDSFISNQKGTIVMSNFKDPGRRDEAMVMKQYLGKKGLLYHVLSDSAYSEGGEFYYSPRDDMLFAGTSRNNKKGVLETAKMLGIKIVCIVESNSFHLDTIFTILLNSAGRISGVIACMDLIKNKKEVKKFLKKYHLRLITIKPIDTIGLDGSGKISVNCLAIPGKLIGGCVFHTKGVEEKINQMGVKHIITPISQFLYSAGGVHCLTNELSYENN